MAELATIARPYAEALFKAATAGAGMDLASTADWVDELAAIAANPQLRQLADNPKVTADQVFAVFTGVARSALSDTAKNFLRSRGLAWDEVRIDLDPVERERMVARTRRTSVPQIFIGDVHVGGYDDLMALHRAGKLDPLLTGGAA